MGQSFTTRMHSSRMLTDRFSCRLGGVCPGGCLPRGLFAQGVCLGGSAWGLSARGVSAFGGGCPPRGGVCLGGVHPPVNRMTDRCKNLLQTSFAGGNYFGIWRISTKLLHVQNVQDSIELCKIVSELVLVPTIRSLRLPSLPDKRFSLNST